MGNDQPQAVQSLRVEDFSGGMTDYYIGNQDPSKFQLGDNLTIDDNRDLVTRPGSEPYNEAFARVSSNAHVMATVECDSVTYQHSGRSLYYINGAMTEVTGPTGNKVFPAGSSTLKGSFAVWNKQLYCAAENYSPIMRVYKDQSGTIRVNNLGLPSTEEFSAIELANSLKAKFNAHILNASQHTGPSGDDTANTVTAANATDFDSLVTLTAQLLTKYAAHRGDAAIVSPLYHAAQSTANALTTTDSPTSLFQIQERLRDLKAKFNAHDADATAHGTTSVNQEFRTTEFQVTAGGAGANTYLYAIYYSHTYFVNNVQFKEIGPVTYVEVTNSLAPDSTSNSLSDLPVVVNGTVNNYATSDIKIEIARTTNGGDILYYLGEVTNGTTTYTDTTSDALLQDSFAIYTAGGALDNTPPPKGKYLRIVNDSLVVANVKEGTVIKPSRARISKQGIPYGHPETFVVDFEDDITGVGGLNVYPLLFLRKKSYRLEGALDSLGRGGYQKREISTRFGCVSHASITDTSDGTVFASEDGFYYTDAFRVTKISREINETYRSLSNIENICGAYDKDKDVVLFGVQFDSSSQYNDKILVGHGAYAKDSGDVPFTTWSGGRSPENFTVTCLAYIDGYLLRGDYRGYLLKHSSDVKTDPRIDTNVDADEWSTTVIIYEYRSIAYDFGSGDTKKWVTKIVVNADNETSLSLDIFSNNDNSGEFKELQPINDRGNIEWGDPTLLWDDDSIRWNYYPTISAWRRFPRNGLRCQYKQVKFSNSYKLLDDSSVVGEADINAVTKEITLLSYPDFDWVNDSPGYFISFASDDYEKEYLITHQDGAVLTVEDGADSLVSGESAWRINGYKKREVLNIINYVLQFGFLTTTQSPYKAQSGEG